MHCLDCCPPFRLSQGTKLNPLCSTAASLAIYFILSNVSVTQSEVIDWESIPSLPVHPAFFSSPLQVHPYFFLFELPLLMPCSPFLYSLDFYSQKFLLGVMRCLRSKIWQLVSSGFRVQTGSAPSVMTVLTHVAQPILHCLFALTHKLAPIEFLPIFGLCAQTGPPEFQRILLAS